LLPKARHFSILIFVAMEIMNSKMFGYGIRPFLFSAVIIVPSWAIASDVVLQKAPPLTVEQAPSYPENVARYHFGADIQTLPVRSSTGSLELSSNGADRNTSAAALLCDDPSTGYELPAGESTILVSLANIENIESVSLLNEGTQGSLTIATSNADVSAASPEWHQLEQRAMTDGALTSKIGPGEAKYVRLTFKITQPGRIASFGVYATPAISDFTMPRPRKLSFESGSDGFALINDNFTDLHLRARALYTSSGDLKKVNQMIDDQPGTAYQFAAGDSSPTAVIDLGRERTITRISAIHAAQPGSVDFYVLNQLPNTPENKSTVAKISNVTQAADLPKSLKISDQTLAGLKPVGSVVSTGRGCASVDFAATTGRYVMLKWHPATTQGEAFTVAQVAAFGRPKWTQDAGKSQMTDSTTGGREVADGKESPDGKQLADGKSILDNKDVPAEGPAEEAQPPAEGPPPALPEVPPFTFIPEVPPTSP
jgi:hypothetical protein